MSQLTPAGLEGLLEQIARWAASQAGLSQILLVGSQANGQARPDSDIDLILICAESARYFANLDWAAGFGSLVEQRSEVWGPLRTLRAFYAGGLEIEFNFAEPSWLAEPLDAGTEQVLQNGYRVIYEKPAA